MDTLSLNPILIALLLSAVTYAIIYWAQKNQGNNKKGLQVALSQSISNAGKSTGHDLIPPAIPDQQLELKLEEQEEDDTWELIEDDSSILLKEAEAVTEQISNVVTNIASDPANPAEVFSKIKAIVSQYKIFEGTDFYDAINRFVSVTVDRELNLRFDEQQLCELWG
ncbi:hypothetical protein [Chitinophaga varians]|uniref:hypothetical protein n=1 Tax=Chitinophaga varians TaxID=2202339 RepID=UPI00165F11B4|nr:hypothetical protein [Chitinophaga varians]MBC9909114.1 hypothetical protein [Chitinophaga varians]